MNASAAALRAKMQSMKKQVDDLKKEVEEKEKILQKEQEAKKKAESEVAALQKRIRQLEDELESTETRLTDATAKLEEASKAADESDRIRRVMAARQTFEDDQITRLTNLVQENAKSVENYQATYEEATRKLAVAEVALAHAEDRIEAAERRSKELQSIVHVTAGQLRSLQHQEVQISQQRQLQTARIEDLLKRLSEAEKRAKEASLLEEAKKLELAKLEETLEAERTNHSNLRNEMENMYSEVWNF